MITEPIILPESLKTRLDWIDQEHDELITEVNGMYQLLRQNFEDVSAELAKKYVIFREKLEVHFHHEESLMQETSFLFLEAHRIHHRKMLSMLDASFREDSLAGGRTRAEKLEQNLLLCLETVVKDIVEADKSFVDFLQDEGYIAPNRQQAEDRQVRY
ncbi:MAG: hemerythrin family protein [Alphaproteobacteria bacterium]|nr:hemerythrin family protein [Alphaproteobacteria bacterium]